MVEYALGVALVALVSLGAVSQLEDDSGDRLDERGATIGSPGDEAIGGAAGDPGPGSGDDDGEVPPEDPPVPYTGDITLTACTGENGNTDTCDFALSVDPAPEVPTWTVSPTQHTSGVPTTGNTATITFNKEGTYVIRALVGTNEVLFTITCVRNNPGNKINCDAA